MKKTYEAVSTEQRLYESLLKELGQIVKQLEEGKALARLMLQALPENTPINQQCDQLMQTFERAKERVTLVWGRVLAAKDRSSK